MNSLQDQDTQVFQPWLHPALSRDLARALLDDQKKWRAAARQAGQPVTRRRWTR